MITVSLNGFENSDSVTATTYPATPDHPPFMAFGLGGVTVILAGAAQARKLAGELHRAADKLDAMPVEPYQPYQSAAVAEEVQF